MWRRGMPGLIFHPVCNIPENRLFGTCHRGEAMHKSGRSQKKQKTKKNQNKKKQCSCHRHSCGCHVHYVSEGAPHKIPQHFVAKRPCDTQFHPVGMKKDVNVNSCYCDVTVATWWKKSKLWSANKHVYGFALIQLERALIDTAPLSARLAPLRMQSGYNKASELQNHSNKLMHILLFYHLNYLNELPNC